LPPIDKILELLKDGEWHEIEEIAGKTQLYEFKVDVLTFLAEYDFIEIDTEERKTRLTALSLSFLREIEDMEKEQ